MLKYLAICLVIANLLDGIMTIAWTSMGIATESNPFMAWALEHSPILFILAKMTLVHFGILALWQEKKRMSVMIAFIGLTCLYGYILVVHVTGIVGVIGAK